MTRMQRPVPIDDDPDTGGFWQAAARGSLAVARCRACDRVLHLPTPYCPACGRNEVVWCDVAPTGHVYSFAVVEQSVHPAFEAPYTLLLVELDGAPQARLVGYLTGRPRVQIGDAVVARFDDERDGVIVPRWELAQP
jgi:uncharacterized OB-fold protein